MSAETRELYTWALELIASLSPDCIPTVVATDREMALMNALRNVFPSTRNSFFSGTKDTRKASRDTESVWNYWHAKRPFRF